MTTRNFPRAGYLVLGVLSIAACLIFVARAAGVEATSERIWSAVAFGVIGALWIWGLLVVGSRLIASSPRRRR